MNDDARRAAERAARTSYGKLLAILAARSRDIALAEDALSEAFASALRSWPLQGVPDNTDAWLLQAARNSFLNIKRHETVVDAAAGEILQRHLERAAQEHVFPDDRLKLMFVCAHPSIAPQVRTPLMLQTVLGLDAAQIASAFLVEPAAMSQRLVRAKAKIKEAGIRFEPPDAEHLSERIGYVLDAIYAAYGTGWDLAAGAEPDRDSLTAEAIYLAEVLVGVLPGAPDAKGLLALMLYCEARQAARRDEQGCYVPLSRQNATLWDRHMIVRAEQLLTEASTMRTFGPYQCLAAIQSVHVQRAVTGNTNYDAIKTLYAMLAAHAPTTGVLVGHAASYLESGDPAEALRTLDAIPTGRVAHALAAAHRFREAVPAAAKAVALTSEPAIRAYLSKSMACWSETAG